MRNVLLRNSWLLATVVLSVVCDASVWARTSTETLKQVGASAMVYKGPQVDLALSYRFVKNNREGNWLLLDTVMTAAAAPIELTRDAISVRMPDGRVVPLASQQEFAKSYPRLASTVMRANAFREPMGYLLPHRVRRMDFFSPPGEHIVFDSVWLDDWHNSYGRFYFDLPGGIRAGEYALMIDLPDGKVTIPFTI